MKLAILGWPQHAQTLPLLHRCAILYLTVPVLIWLVGWFEWWFGVPAALLVGLALAPALRGDWRPRRPSPAALGIVALGIACTMLTAHGALFDVVQYDWWDRRALLLDLSRRPWPVFIRDDLADYLPWGGGERVALLRYYLGWYMVPGLAGRAFGAAALNWAVPLWSATGLGLALLLFARGLGGRRAVLAAAVFVLFGGMDVLRFLLTQGPEWFGLRLDERGWPGVTVNVEFRYRPRGNYLSHFRSFQVSTDILAAAICALLIVHLRRHRRFVATSGVVLAAAVFWSPFVAFGLLPFIAILLWEHRQRVAALASWSNLLGIPLAVLLAIYLSSGALDFRYGWVGEGYSWRQILQWAQTFYITEFLALLLFLLLLRPRLARNPIFLAMSATLLLLPLYRFGGMNSMMKGVLPALVLLSWFCARALLVPETRNRPGKRTRQAARATACRRIGFCGVLCCLGIGATEPLLYLAVATRDDVPFSYAASGLTNFATLGQPRENLAAEVPPLLEAVLKAPVVETPKNLGEPLLRAGFDIHVREKNLVLVNERCDHDDRLLRLRFPNPDTNARHVFDAAPRWYGGGCGAIVSLPGWRFRHAWVGQTPPDGGDWAVEILFDESGEAVGLNRPPYCAFRSGDSGRDCPTYPGIAVLRKAYERTRSGAPAAQSRFDVYVDDEWITHVREPCVFADMEARVFLHLVPADPADLPPARKPAGFDNRDFTFGDRGSLFDGKCVAVSRLPYAVREARTGQFSAAGPIWSTTVRPAKR